jgi:hypothetical protein
MDSMVRLVLERMRNTSFGEEGDERKSGAKPEVLEERATCCSLSRLSFLGEDGLSWRRDS